MQRFDIAPGTTRFPDSLYDHVETLEVMNLSGASLRALPPDLARFRKLKVLFASGNPLEGFPEDLEGCDRLEMVGFRGCGMKHWRSAQLPPRLRALVLTDNTLSEVPAELGNCQSLEKLMLSGNQLTALPETCRGLENLEMLRLASNAFEKLPVWLFELPKLRWLAMGGNPVVKEVGAFTLTSYPWESFNVGEPLGRGASGEVFSAIHPQLGEVALKVYLAENTSDGSPQSEIVAWQQVPKNEAFLSCLGEVVGHPEGKRVVAMPRLPQGSRSVAQPPTLATCTRDVYDRPLGLKVDEVKAWLHQLAMMGQRLHERSLMHGDFYAHNVHTDPQQPRKLTLGDFGASACYAGIAGAKDRAEQVEVLAFATLAQELLAQVEGETCGEVQAWSRLLAACENPKVVERPSFEELARCFA